MEPIKIVVVGAGYVGLSMATLLSQHNEVVIHDIDADKIAVLNKGRSPIDDPEIEDYLLNKPLNLTATLDKRAAYQGASYVIIATPTDYSVEKIPLIPLRWRPSSRTSYPSSQTRRW